MNLKRFLILTYKVIFSFVFLCGAIQCSNNSQSEDIEKGFKNPPVSAKSGVYWYFMDGNFSKEGITKDLESMVRVGISHVIFLEVNVGVPRGKVDMLSTEWKDMFKHAVKECERLGVEMTLGVGPGWTGSGGPWVKPEESMQHLVSSSVIVDGSEIKNVILPKPAPKRPFFGERNFTPELHKQWQEFYEDIAVLAFPTPKGDDVIGDTDEKSLYYRAPYSSQPGVKQFLPMSSSYADAINSAVNPEDIKDITAWMKPDGTIEGDLPAGKWTIMRFGVRNNGAITRPAPAPGLGFEADKLDTVAMSHHMDKFVGELFRHIGFTKRTSKSPSGGLTMLHMDSWEMGAQNWTGSFRKEFELRRGYDPQPYFPAYSGLIVGSRELSERFLWDMRKTVQELILENHAGYIREYAHRHGLGFSVEPYDMNPTADLELATISDVPMCEYWSVGYGFNTSFSLAEGTSIAHLKGQQVVPAESFTAQFDGWDQYPGKMKNQTDWALAGGVNRFMFHTFQHQCLPDSLRPGMTMGPYGVHWDRNQTWWEMGKAYHDYLSRCQFMMQQGRTVSDILYFSPEGNPHVFRAPASAYLGTDTLPDKRGYAFDACPPSFLYKASVKDGKIVFPSGAEYRILVLPTFETMTPEILKKIKGLLLDGATVVGMPPTKSPSLQGYPQCDNEIASLVKEIWGEGAAPDKTETRTVGKGKIIWSKEILNNHDNLYPNYDFTARILAGMDTPEDFVSDGDLRYAHRTTDNCDIYFVSNRSGKQISANCTFRISGMIPELWDAMTGEIRELKQYTIKDNRTIVPMVFDTDQSFFVVFRKQGTPSSEVKNFLSYTTLQTMEGPWDVSFDPAWGGPAKTVFNELADWTMHTDEGIKYYSGTAVYEQTFDFDTKSSNPLYLNLGEVNIMAKVWLNDEEVGTVWTYPWQVDISNYIKSGENKLKIEVVNLWVNRLVGDCLLPEGSKPYTYTTFRHYNKDTSLSKSGLIGPVRLLEAK
ncbi:glycosyl hydrolase [Prevotella sp. 10(H)]|uniref:glycosyl hydrolase n=1 Tax=Prevotella sp. 10(H) TaxID=1158294 RepID=UPI000568B285|nr:glycosyl hydrolase [Prevotella sp. 10(H)]